jgi:murein DD-endopeptidase MepM/ murein hydrolase activator NlpD
MDIAKIRWCGIARTGLTVILAGLLGACGIQSDPAPVFQRGGAEPIVALPPPPPPRQVIVVRRGQTLGGVAQTYHVPKSAIIAANGLKPPYELVAGARLVIPGAGGPVHQAMGSPPGGSVVAATPLPPPHAESLAPPPQMPAAGPPPAAAHASPDIIPLDGPLPTQAASAPPTTLTPPKPGAASPPAGQPSVQASVSAESGQGSNGQGTAGRFPWPVRGRVLANYGNMPGGGHNDGINIAAPRGTPVRSIDAGTVAYVGNEVKGYGNLVLIRHANGWISAYAHLDDLTVKPGDTIATGQVIAKVGDSGGVPEPQLHFELRRGKKPVDPKEFLTPAPSASNPAGNKAG